MEAIRIFISLKESADLSLIQWAVNAAQLHFQFVPNDPSESLFSILSQNEIDCIICDYAPERGARLLLDHLQTLKKTIPMIVITGPNQEPANFEPHQGRVSAEMQKGQITPQSIGQLIVSLTQLKREIQRGQIVEARLQRERQRLSTLAREYPFAFIDMDKKGIVLQGGGGVLRQLNMDLGQCIGKPIWQVFPKEFDVEDAIYNTLSGDPYTKQYATPEGVLDCRFFPVHDENRIITGITAIFMLVQTGEDSAAVERESQLRALQQRNLELTQKNQELQATNAVLQQFMDNYHGILKSTESALFQVLVDEDNQLSIPYMSRSIKQLTGFDAEQLVLPEVREQLFSADALPRLAVELNAAVSQWLPVSTEVTIYPAEGEPRRLRVVAKPSAHPKGLLWDGFLHTIAESAVEGGNDVVPEESVSEVMEERDAALEEVKLKSHFLSSMSREMRTPLETMLTMVNLLMESQLQAEQREFAAMLYTCGHALITMTNDIMDVSHVESESFHLTEVDFDLRLLVDDLVGRYQRKAGVRGMKIYSLQPYTIPQYVHGDAGRLRQILSHLLSNTLQYSKANEVTLQMLMVEESETEWRLRFEISDAGMVITTKDRRYLFQLFAPQDNDDTVIYRSAGLRMLVARQLTEMMGGEFGLLHNVKQGVTFWCNLPLKKAQLSVPSPARPEVAPELTGKRVLVVSDNGSSGKSLKQAMASCQVDVAVSQSGDDALACLIGGADGGKPFHAVILDASMAMMRDMELAKIIHGNAKLQGLKQILLADVGERGDSEKARLAGIAGFLTKPAQSDLLQECLRAVLAMPNTKQASTLVTRHSLADKIAGKRPAVLLGVTDTQQQKNLQFFLASLGVRVDVVPSGPETLSAMQKNTYGLVVLAHDLAIWDGFATARILHNRITTPPVMVGFVTQVNKQEQDRCTEAGMEECIDGQSLHRLRALLEQPAAVTTG